MFSTPVLLLGFNRPDFSRRVLDALRKIKPERLYIAVDGPRPGVSGDDVACHEVQGLADEVDWTCEVRTLFQHTNLGCRRGVSTAITWFFAQEEAGIILEDDCIPSLSFFPYVEELLDRYAAEPKVMAISGDNFLGEEGGVRLSYRFSRYPHVWGWATWRRAWLLYDDSMSLWPEFRDSGALSSISCGNPWFEQYWSSVFNRVAQEQIDSWAYRWTFACWLHGGLASVPNVNLVTNVGFDERSVHTTKRSKQAFMPAGELDFPLVHPKFVARDFQADASVDVECFGIKAPSVSRRVKQWIRDRRQH